MWRVGEVDKPHQQLKTGQVQISTGPVGKQNIRFRNLVRPDHAPVAIITPNRDPCVKNKVQQNASKVEYGQSLFAP
jgi:hypothetical protein